MSGRVVIAAVSASVLLAGPAWAAPETTITAGPSGVTTATSATLEFASSEPGRFECRLDADPFSACASPFTTPTLAPGAHHFEVRAIDAAGTADATPAVRDWTVTTLQPPTVAVTEPSRRALKASALRQISGTASSPLGVAGVRVALRRFGKQKQPGEPAVCRFASLRTGRLLERLCVLPPWRRATGTEQWTVAIPSAVRRHLPAGSYELQVRAADPNGQVRVLHRKLVIERSR